MENWWYQWQTSKIRQQEILEQVQRDAMVKKMRLNNGQNPNSLAAMLYQTGSLFINFGSYLQTHFGNSCSIHSNLNESFKKG